MSEATYTVLTWDCVVQCYTPQEGMETPCIDVPLQTLRAALKELRTMGYGCHRRRSPDGSHPDNDHAVLVERTDCDAELELCLKELP